MDLMRDDSGALPESFLGLLPHDVAVSMLQYLSTVDLQVCDTWCLSARLFLLP
jgi:hypothetical protein